MDRTREAFEKWAKENNFGLHLYGGKYAEDATAVAWRAWQAAHDEMFPVFEVLERLMKNGFDIEYDGEKFYLYELETGDLCVNLDTQIAGKTFRELCVNILMAEL